MGIMVSTSSKPQTGLNAEPFELEEVASVYKIGISKSLKNRFFGLNTIDVPAEKELSSRKEGIKLFLAKIG